MLTMVFAILFYAAAAILALGLAHRIHRYATVPAPLKIPITPAPTTAAGVVLRMLREVVLFETLFRSNKWIWLFGWTFHAALVVVLLGHLRYVTEPVWLLIVWIQPFAKYAAVALIGGLGGLWFRRVALDRIRYVSGPSDHLMLLLLAAIAVTGLLMRYVERVDIVGLKAFVLGLVYFDWQPLPGNPLLLLHLGLVAALMIVFPFSKLLHAPGVFFSPTLNQIDNPREKRHVTPWAAVPGAGDRT